MQSPCYECAKALPKRPGEKKGRCKAAAAWTKDCLKSIVLDSFHTRVLNDLLRKSPLHRCTLLKEKNPPKNSKPDKQQKNHTTTHHPPQKPPNIPTLKHRLIPVQ